MSRLSTSGLCTRSNVQLSKGDLISESFSVSISPKKYQITILSFFNLWVVLRIVFGNFFGDLRKREKLSMIKPPLTLFTKKVLISYCVLYHKWILFNGTKTFNLECKITCKITLIPDHNSSILWLGIYFWQNIFPISNYSSSHISKKRWRKKMKRSHYFNRRIIHVKKKLLQQ